MYNTTMNTLTYTIMAENASSIAWPGEFGQSVLVIDSTNQGKRKNGAAQQTFSEVELDNGHHGGHDGKRGGTDNPMG